MSDTPAPTILPFMIGTAGHVDHGKTSLVRNLTGLETDRAPEEKRRGMSIDFGVVPFKLSDGQLIGIIDVPGHEDFIANMVAGAASIDLLMLIVAADDAVMPQTREHLLIASLLGISKLIVVLTKVDLVDADLRTLVRDDIREFLRGTPFLGAPIMEISNETREGIESLREEIERTVTELSRKPDPRAFRMDVRKGFTLKGHGTVSTGVPISGQIAAGEALTLLPAGKAVAIRAVQTYSHQTGIARAHVSSALNLRDTGVDELERGMTLIADGAYHESKFLFVHFKNVSSAWTFKKRSIIRLHLGTAKLTVACRLVGAEEVPPGNTGFACLILEKPIVAAAGDRFILRNPSPSLTIAGGRILGATEGVPRRRDDTLLRRLGHAVSAVERDNWLGAAILTSRRPVLRTQWLIRATQQDPSAAKVTLEQAKEDRMLAYLGTDHWLVIERLGELQNYLKGALKRYHRANKLALGMKPGYVCEILGVPADCFERLWTHLKTDTEMLLNHGSVALKGFAPEVSPRLMKARGEIARLVSEAGMNTLARGTLREQLGLSEPEFKQILKLLTEEQEIIVLGNNLMVRSLWEQCRQKLLELFQQHKVVELPAFRDATGTSRNIATIILDGFDAVGITKRTESGRVLLKKPESITE